MLRHVAQPLHARRLEADVGIKAPGDGAVDDGLLLLLQQVDQLLLGADVAANASVCIIEEADDGGLFGKRWKRCLDAERNVFGGIVFLRPEYSGLSNFRSSIAR